MVAPFMSAQIGHPGVAVASDCLINQQLVFCSTGVSTNALLCCAHILIHVPTYLKKRFETKSSGPDFKIKICYPSQTTTRRHNPSSSLKMMTFKSHFSSN